MWGCVFEQLYTKNERKDLGEIDLKQCETLYACSRTDTIVDGVKVSPMLCSGLAGLKTFNFHLISW